MRYSKTVRSIRARQMARELLRTAKTATRSGVVVVIDKLAKSVVFFGNTRTSPVLTFDARDNDELKLKVHRAAVAWAAKTRQTRVTVKPLKSDEGMNPERQVEIWVLADDDMVDQSSKELLSAFRADVDQQAAIYQLKHNTPKQGDATIVFDVTYDANETTESGFESMIKDIVYNVDGVDIDQIKYLTGPSADDYDDPNAPDNYRDL